MSQSFEPKKNLFLLTLAAFTASVNTNAGTQVNNGGVTLKCRSFNQKTFSFRNTRILFDIENRPELNGALRKCGPSGSVVSLEVDLACATQILESASGRNIVDAQAALGVLKEIQIQWTYRDFPRSTDLEHAYRQRPLFKEGCLPELTAVNQAHLIRDPSLSRVVEVNRAHYFEMSRLSRVGLWIHEAVYIAKIEDRQIFPKPDWSEQIREKVRQIFEINLDSQRN